MATCKSPFRNVKDGPEESAANRESLGNSKKSGECPPLVSQLHLTANSNYFRFIYTFQELQDIFFGLVKVFSGLFSHLIIPSPFVRM